MIDILNIIALKGKNLCNVYSNLQRHGTSIPSKKKTCAIIEQIKIMNTTYSYVIGNFGFNPSRIEFSSP